MTTITLKDPGVVGNDIDGMSCLHACTQMVMKIREGGPVYSFEKINKILRRKPGYYSWGYAIAERLSQEGFDIRSFSLFSIKRFVEEKELYLLEYYGEEAGRVQIEYADMPVVLEDAARFMQSKGIERFGRTPSLDDVREALAEGWYVVPLVNCRVLNGRAGYAGHYIFIYGCDENGVVFHDPLKEPIAGRRVSWELFEKAWSSPKVETRSMNCYRARPPSP